MKMQTNENESMRKRIHIASLLVLTAICLALAAILAWAQNTVPPTARQAASSPEFASRLADQAAAQKVSGAGTFVPSRGALSEGTLYTNGPYNGTTDAWTINFGFSVSDSFTVPSNSSIEDFHFVYWDATSYDLLTTVDMQIGTTSFGGTPQTLTGVTNTFLGINQFGYFLYQADYSFANIPWSGDGYITLSNACTTSGCSVSTPIYWDENSGPSTAYEYTLGSIPSESFTATGTSSTKTVVCISANLTEYPPPMEDNFLSNAEGYYRSLSYDKPPNILETNLADPGQFTHCLNNVDDGDTLIIVAHSWRLGEAICWGGVDGDHQYNGFGSGDHLLPVPDKYGTLQNLKVIMDICYSNCGADDKSLCGRFLKVAPDPTNSCQGFSGECKFTSGAALNPPPTPTQQKELQACFDRARKTIDGRWGPYIINWQSYPPENAPGPPKDNQLSEAEKIVNGCDKLKGMFTVKVARGPAGDIPPFCEAPASPASGNAPEVCGASGSFVGPPAQTQVSGPSQVQVGAPTSITSTVEGMKIPGQRVIYTTLAGSVVYLNGVDSGDGKSATLVTDDGGEAAAIVRPTSAGQVLIMITVPGTDLVQYFSFTAY